MKQAAESAQAQTSKVGVGASAGQMGLANKAKKLMESGIETPAHIDSMEPTGNTDKPGGAENVINATVKPAGGDALRGDLQPVHLPLGPVQRGRGRRWSVSIPTTRTA